MKKSRTTLFFLLCSNVAFLACSGFVRAQSLSAPSGLVSLWPGDENANDIVAGNNGSALNGSTYTNGEVNQAFVLPGVSNPFSKPLDGPQVIIPKSNLWSFGTNDFTIELWANWSSFVPGSSRGEPHGGFIIGTDEGSGSRPKWLFARGGNTLEFHINSPTLNGGAGFFLAQYTFNPTLNNWYHLGVTRKGPLYTIYVNGVAVSSESNTHVIPDVNAPLILGAGEGFYFNGLLDEVAIYNRALTSNEMASIYTSGLEGKTSLASIKSQPSGKPFMATSASLQSTANPILTISIQNDEVLLQWPAWASDFNLQSAEISGPSPSWSDVLATVVTNGANVQVALPASEQQRIFRLRHP